METDQIIQIVVIVVGLGILWLVVRAVFKLATKVFTCGCSLIVLIGVGLFLMRLFGNS